MTTLNKIEAVLSVTQHAKGWTKADSEEPTPISASLQAADKMFGALLTIENLAAHWETLAPGDQYYARMVRSAITEALG